MGVLIYFLLMFCHIKNYNRSHFFVIEFQMSTNTVLNFGLCWPTIRISLFGFHVERKKKKIFSPQKQAIKNIHVLHPICMRKRKIKVKYWNKAHLYSWLMCFVWVAASSSTKKLKEKKKKKPSLDKATYALINSMHLDSVCSAYSSFLSYQNIMRLSGAT